MTSGGSTSAAGAHVVVEGQHEPSAPARLVGFDTLRAGAMLLGIAYHATFAYVPGMGRWYVVEDLATHPLFAVLGSVLHVFRIPVFFVLSGFFAHRVAFQKGVAGFMKDRWRRLLVPLLLTAPVVVAFDVASRRWAHEHGLLHPSYDGGTAVLLRPLHLWFLLCLVLFSALAAPMVAPAPNRVVAWAGQALAARPLLLVLLTPVTALSTVWVGEATPAFSFMPQLATVLAYGPCFAVGWVLYSARDDLHHLRPWWPSVLVGLALATWVTSRPIQWEPRGMWLSALATWLSVLGSLGLAARPWRSNTLLQRAVEASYWVYLTHYPVVVAAQLVWAKEPWPVWVKYALVVAATTVVTFGTHALVRTAKARRRAAQASG